MYYVRLNILYDRQLFGICFIIVTFKPYNTFQRITIKNRHIFYENINKSFKNVRFSNFH